MKIDLVRIFKFEIVLSALDMSSIFLVRMGYCSDRNVKKRKT